MITAPASMRSRPTNFPIDRVFFFTLTKPKWSINTPPAICPVCVATAVMLVPMIGAIAAVMKTNMAPIVPPIHIHQGYFSSDRNCIFGRRISNSTNSANTPIAKDMSDALIGADIHLPKYPLMVICRAELPPARIPKSRHFHKDRSCLPLLP